MRLPVLALAASALLAGPTLLAQGVTIEPASASVDLDPNETKTLNVKVCIPGKTTASKVDVYLLADTTGSMGSVISSVRNNVSTVVNTLLATGEDLAIGVGDYKDFPFDPYAFRHTLDPSKNVAAITSAINTWSASGGADGSEGQLYALTRIANGEAGVDWRPDAQRIIVWFGDAPGHDPICTAISGYTKNITEASTIADLQASGVGGATVVAIGTPTGYAQNLNDNPQLSASNYFPYCTIGGSSGQATRIANGTGGSYQTISSSSAIVSAILSAVEDAVSKVDVSLCATGDTAPFVTNISPAVHKDVLIPQDESQEVCKVFTVELTGGACTENHPEEFLGGLCVKFDNLPVDGTELDLTITQEVCLIVEAPLDIHPTSCPNPMVVGRPGIEPVALLGTAEVDLSTVLAETIELEGVKPLWITVDDVATPYSPFVGRSDCRDCTTAGPDGRADIVMFFDARELAATIGAYERFECRVLKLTAKLNDNRTLVAEDVVRLQ